VIGAYYTGSAWLGLLTGVLAGVILAGIHAICTLRFKADQVVSGVAINLFTVGVTRFLLQLAFDSSSNSPRVAGFGGEDVAGALALASNPLVWLGMAAMPVLAFVIQRTTFGLRVRAVGEHPVAATTLGVPVQRVRYVAVLMSGALAALGGTYLALDQHQFTDSMTAGRGFIALAAVIFGRWIPARAGIACLLFAAAETLQIRLQGAELIPSQFVAMIPYVLTIVAVAGVVGRSVPPAALGRTSD
jgi:ABC-type uncharacterized transport system permease subunit